MSMTLKSIPATIAPDGSVTLSEPLELREPTSAMVTIAVADSDESIEPALLSEAALDDWNHPEEDAAWEYLSEVIQWSSAFPIPT